MYDHLNALQNNSYEMSIFNFLLRGCKQKQKKELNKTRFLFILRKKKQNKRKQKKEEWRGDFFCKIKFFVYSIKRGKEKLDFHNDKNTFLIKNHFYFISIFFFFFLFSLAYSIACILAHSGCMSKRMKS